MKKVRLLLISLLWIWAGCSGSGEPDEAPRVFRLNLSAPLTSLDPAFSSDQPNSWACLQLYNGLVQLDKDLQVVPAIASNWEISEDQLTYTFHLRRDVTFHNDPCFDGGHGRQVTADDFVYSFGRLIDPETAARGFWVFDQLLDAEHPFLAPDDSTLIIQLRAPFAPFLQRLCMPYCSVVPIEALDRYGKDFRSHPVGTGPFTFVRWLEGNMLILHRNEKYFETDSAGRPLPYLDAVNFRFIANKSTEFLKFMNGELDFVSDIDVSLKNQVLTADGRLRENYSDRFQLLKGPYLNVEYLSILMDSNAAVLEGNPLQFRQIRQAINLAFSREEMLLFLRSNRGIPATGGIVPPSLLGQQASTRYGYQYDPARAAALLDEAGFTGGVGLPEIVLHTTAEYQDFATYLKDKLEDIGIALRIETTDPRVLREMRVKEETAFFRSSWIADYSDAESYLQMFYGGNSAPPNYTRFSDIAYDSLYVKAVRETSAPERVRLYRQMDSLMMQEAPVIPLYYDEVYRFVSKEVSGLEPDALNHLRLKTVHFIKVAD